MNYEHPSEMRTTDLFEEFMKLVAMRDANTLRDGQGARLGAVRIELDLRTVPKDRLGLTFQRLRAANFARLQHFKDANGTPVHSASGHDWTPSQWFNALVGEVGEYAGWAKKFDRGDIDEATFKREAAKELADIQTYLDILAARIGVDLAKATVEKFNEVSQRIGSEVTL